MENARHFLRLWNTAGVIAIVIIELLNIIG